MAGFAFEIDTGQIDVGDTKTLTLASRDDAGGLVQLSALALSVEEGGGTETTYDLSDAVEDSKTYVLEHTFTESGSADFDAKVTDMGNRTERETDSKYIHP